MQNNEDKARTPLFLSDVNNFLAGVDKALEDFFAKVINIHDVLATGTSIFKFNIHY